MAVTSIFLSILLSNQRYESFNPRYQEMELFTSTETMRKTQNQNERSKEVTKSYQLNSILALVIS